MNRHDFVRASAVFTAGIALAEPTIALANASVPAFHFQSSFWVNLHHTLYYQAQVLETAYSTGVAHLSPMDRGALADLKSIASVHEADWYRALRIYQQTYTSQDFVFSDVMQGIDNALSLAVNASMPLSKALPAPLLQAFALTAPAYRSSQWIRDDARNRAFIGGLQKHIARFGPQLSRRLAHIYRTPWLDEPIRVDVMPYAYVEGSYSNMADGFVHIAMSTSDPDEQGISGLDVLFHETSHSIADPQYGTIGNAITAAAKRANRPAPDQFWHAVIMYTPGKLCEEMFDRAGLGPYTMFAKREGLFTRAWPRYWDVLVRYWQPYMDGKGTLESAITQCVDAIVDVLT